MLQDHAYFEPGQNGSPALLSLDRAAREFKEETRSFQKYPELFKPASISFYFRSGKKQGILKLSSDKSMQFCPCGLPIVNGKCVEETIFNHEIFWD